MEHISSFKGFNNEEVAILLIKHGNGSQLAKRLSMHSFEDANKERLALFIIQEGQGNAVASNLQNFEGVDQNYIVKLLFQTGNELSLIENIRQFHEVDHQVLMEKLIDTGFAKEAIEKATSFESGFKINGEKTIRYLFEKGMGSIVKVALKKDEYHKLFGELPEDLALLLIEKDPEFAFEELGHFINLSFDTAKILFGQIKEANFKQVIYGRSFGAKKRIDAFPPEVRQKIAKYLSERMESSELIGMLDSFNLPNKEEIVALLDMAEKDAEFLQRIGEKDELLAKRNHEELAQSIIKSGKQEILLRNLSKLKGLSKETAAALVVAQGDEIIKDIILYRMGSFDSLPADFALKSLVKEKYGEAQETKDLRRIILKNLKMFSLEDDPDGFFLKFVSLLGNVYIAADYLGQFPVLSKETATTLINQGWVGVVTKDLDRFEGIDNDEMFEFMMNNPKKGAGKAYLSSYITKFKNIDFVKASEILIKEGGGAGVAEHLKHLKGLNHVETARKLIDSGSGPAVAQHLYNFEGVDHNEIAKKLINIGEGDAVAKYINNFKDIDHNEIADLLIADKKYKAIVENLYKFKNLKNEIALRLIRDGYSEAVAKALSRFEGLNGETAIELTQVGKGFMVIKNLEKFSNIDYALLATTLIKMGQAETVACHIEKFVGVDIKAAAELIKATGQEKVLKYTLEPKSADVSQIKDTKRNDKRNDDLDLSSAFKPAWLEE